MGRKGRVADTQNRLVPNSCVVDIKQRDMSRVRDHNPLSYHPAWGSSAKKINLHNFGL